MENGASTTGTGARAVSLSISASAPEAGLYLVATPIGAARDITLRALDVLNTADVLAAEDTRNLRHLMDIHGIALRGRRLIAYHDHNADRARPAVLAALEQGLPACAGVALGVDRLLMALLGTARIADVLAFDFARA